MKLAAVLLALGVALDFVTTNRRPAIYERFYSWWCRLAALNLAAAGDKGVLWFTTLVDRIFGKKVLSSRGLFTSILFTVAATMTVSVGNFGGPMALRQKMILGAVVYPMIIIPIFLNLQITRIALHRLQRRVTFSRVLLFGILNGLLVEVTVFACYGLLGAFAASMGRIAFDHNLAMADIGPVSAVLLLLSIALAGRYLLAAVLPALCCMVAWITFMLVYASSKLGLWIQHFLKDRIEQSWQAPFSTIAAVCVAFITLAATLTAAIPVNLITSKVLESHQLLSVSAVRYGSFGGGAVMIYFSADRPGLAQYYRSWSQELRRFKNGSFPTPEEVKALLVDHLPKLAEQWRGSNGAGKVEQEGGVP